MRGGVSETSQQLSESEPGNGGWEACSGSESTWEALGDQGLGRGCCIIDSVRPKTVNCPHHCIPSVLPSAWHIENTQ